MSKKNKFQTIIIIIGILIIAVVALLAFYKLVLRKPYEDLAKLNNTVTELEKENQQLKDQIEKNQTAFGEKEGSKSLGLAGGSFLLLSIGLGIALLIILFKKNRGIEKNMDEITKFLRGTPEKDYKDGYIKKIDGRRLYKRIDYEQFNYKGKKKAALIVFCINPFHNFGANNYYKEPSKAQLIGYVIDRTNLKNIITTFDRGDMSCAEMLEAAMKTHRGMRGIHWVDPDDPKWKKNLEEAVQHQFEYEDTLRRHGEIIRGEI